jgi:phosphoribosylaminoimidazole-succinocarboxamide synthase
MKPELLHRGSVKDIYRLSEQELLFRFSDRYSIFDWGEMPDAIPGKGEALALMGRKLLAHLEQCGFTTHYLGEGFEARDMKVKSVDVPRGNIEIYQSQPKNILIPLEVIFRFGAPKGSSLLRRYKTENEWKAAGFDHQYLEGEFFNEIKIDFTTKLERQDRVLTDAEAKKLAGMSDAEWAELKSLTTKIANEIKIVFGKFNAKMWDGKFEFAFDQNRKIILVDSIGLDEMRLTFEDAPLSKELLRQHYLSSSWYTALSRAKETHPEDFKEYCLNQLHEKPSLLPAATMSALSMLYSTVAKLILCETAERAPLQAKLAESLSYLVKRS